MSLVVWDRAGAKGEWHKIMELLKFETHSLWINAVIALAAAGVTWFAGVRLTRYAKTISEQTGAGQALIGMLLLGGIVSLPEMAMAMTASAFGNAQLAVNTLLGGIPVTMAILAVTDAAVGREPLSLDVSHPIVLLQGTFVVAFLAVAAGIIVGDIPTLGVGAWASALFVLYIVFTLLIKRYSKSAPWVPKQRNAEPQGQRKEQQKAASAQPGNANEEHSDRRPMGRIALCAAIAGAAILVAGFLLARSGEALAEQTGLGASFVGMVLGGISTSLPEVSTTVSAVRLQQYEMTFADAFGTNLFSVMLIFLVDVVYSGGPVLNELGRFSVFAILLGIAVTTVYLAGLIERRNRAILRMGVDSLIVLCMYLLGLIILFRLRSV